MADTSDFRTGFTMEIDGNLVSIVEFQHVKPGKGGAFVRTKLKYVESGKVVDKTFRAGEKVEEVRLENHEYQYLFNDGDMYTFMHTETFEQIGLPKEALTDAIPYLKENDTVTMLMRGEKPITVEVANHVELEVAKADPGVKGDTAQGGTKPAELETGLVVQVPLFVEEGDVLRIDTRTGKYLTRV
ncbi:MAG TPA: elongation factor P [Candidatus Krumholzibacteria bacterium]|nr:elongation factor P [Candidatus Krumholzibacteria bacterium]